MRPRASVAGRPMPRQPPGTASCSSPSRSARPNSPALANRSAGVFDSALATARSTPSGTVSRTRRSGCGVSVNRRAISSAPSAPRTAAHPRASPRAHRRASTDPSVRRAQLRPPPAQDSRTPASQPSSRCLSAAVTWTVSPRRSRRPSTRRHLAIPKSATSACRREQNVLRLHVPMDHALAVRVVEGVRRLARDLHRLVHRQLLLPRQPLAAASRRPRTACANQHGWPLGVAGSSPESWTERMCGCWSRAAVRISRWKRSGPRLLARSPCSTLRATGRSCRRSCARYTVAMPPRPAPLEAVATRTSEAAESEKGLPFGFSATASPGNITTPPYRPACPGRSGLLDVVSIKSAE